MSDSNIPYGYCHCGCGEKTNCAKQNHTKFGWVKGEPVKYRSGHNSVKSPGPPYLINKETGCWEWQRSISADGYAKVGDRDGGAQLAHRRIYEKHKGTIPIGKDLDHICRNRACVNPDHLEPVTRCENVRRGALPKLTLQDARLMREVRSITNISYAKLAVLFGCKKPTAISICKHRTWKEF